MKFERDLYVDINEKDNITTYITNDCYMCCHFNEITEILDKIVELACTERYLYDDYSQKIPSKQDSNVYILGGTSMFIDLHNKLETKGIISNILPLRRKIDKRRMLTARL